MKLFRDFLILVIVFAVLWIAFLFVSKSGVLSPDIRIEISMENEEKLGDLVMDAFLSNVDLTENRLADSAVYVIHQHLMEGLEYTDFNYQIYVVESPQVNAFATLGGNIVIFTGLLEFAESPEEVASVLAHEMGHVEHRHVISKLIKEMGVTVLFSILGGDLILLSEVSRTATSTVFDRRMEREADEFALELLEKSNINPKSLASFFMRVEREYGGFDKNIEFLMTHPHNQSRIKMAVEYETKEDFEEMPIALDWDEVRSSIKKNKQ
ncbi:MAG: hypothetical protein EA412_08700 [Chitinophagaceae bacterium]|nr:MAG: hypothetical protein EA412_08700 [Chitinophagaceae bacterium]